MKIVELQKVLKKVYLAREIIKSNFFDDEMITLICRKLGFSDTAFRDKKQADKLNDFLLSKEYWTNKHRKLTRTNP